MNFMHNPLKRKPLVLKSFSSVATNLKIMRLDCDVLLGYKKLGYFYCSHFTKHHEQYINEHNQYQYFALLRGLKKVEYLTQEEAEVEEEEVKKMLRRTRIERQKRDIASVLENPEFLDYLKKIKDKLPEFLTSNDSATQKFATSLIKLKEVMD